MNGNEATILDRRQSAAGRNLASTNSNDHDGARRARFDTDVPAARASELPDVGGEVLTSDHVTYDSDLDAISGQVLSNKIDDSSTSGHRSEVYFALRCAAQAKHRISP